MICYISYIIFNGYAVIPPTPSAGGGRAGGRAVCFRSESTRITSCQGAIRHVVQNLFKLVRSICDVV